MYKISGKVVKGDGYGRKLGFPTANVEIKDGNIPPQGVYAGKVVFEGKVYRAGILIGPNKKIEVHLLNYDGDMYSKELTLETEKFLRGYKKFDTEEELIEQIKKDIKQC